MIARVFPRRTKATPTDDYSFIGEPGLFTPDDIAEVHISVSFSWDLAEAERLAESWRRIAPVKIGGPATGARGEAFEPGVYLQAGYVITSRGCPNRCWFCGVPGREGEVRELPIREGRNVLDDNLLACSRPHVEAVFDMLEAQKGPVKFTGGLEAKRLEPWHVGRLKDLRPKEIFFAFDTPDDLEPLIEARRLFRAAEYGNRNNLFCYVLIGFPGDTFAAAEDRLKKITRLDMCPMAMLYRDRAGGKPDDWRKFQRAWARPALIFGKRDNRHLRICG